MGEVAKVVFVAGWGAALVVVLVGFALVGVAGLIYATKGNSGVAVADTLEKPEPPKIKPPTVPPKVDTKVQGKTEAKVEPPPTVPPKVDTKVTSKVSKPPEPKVVPKPPADPPPTVVVVPQTTVVTPPTVEQCVKVSPPASTSIGADLIVKATLCNEDGTPVTLWYRPSGGTWQSKMMPKALGAHTTKLQIDATYNYGLEIYVEAGSVSRGSRTAPLIVAVQ